MRNDEVRRFLHFTTVVIAERINEIFNAQSGLSRCDETLVQYYYVTLCNARVTCLACLCNLVRPVLVLCDNRTIVIVVALLQ